MQKKIQRKIKTFIALGFCLSFLGGKALALTMDKRYLRAFDLQTRLEQRCDLEALDRIARETKFRPDKVLAYAFGDFQSIGNKLIVNGAAFRSNGKWYRLSYQCQTTHDAMNILSFQYQIGEEVPRELWSKHYLVP